MTADSLDFARPSRPAIMIPRRKNGDLQTSIVTAVPTPDGEIWVWTRGDTAKMKNLRRDPRATLCVIEGDFRNWTHVDATAAIVRQPEALPLLDDYYRFRHGKEHDNWDGWRAEMLKDVRHLFRLTPTRVFHPVR